MDRNKRTAADAEKIGFTVIEVESILPDAAEKDSFCDEILQVLKDSIAKRLLQLVFDPVTP